MFGWGFTELLGCRGRAGDWQARQPGYATRFTNWNRQNEVADTSRPR
jgi:hypothetical protein